MESEKNLKVSNRVITVENIHRFRGSYDSQSCVAAITEYKTFLICSEDLSQSWTLDRNDDSVESAEWTRTIKYWLEPITQDKWFQFYCHYGLSANKCELGLSHSRRLQAWIKKINNPRSIYAISDHPEPNSVKGKRGARWTDVGKLSLSEAICATKSIIQFLKSTYTDLLWFRMLIHSTVYSREKWTHRKNQKDSVGPNHWHSEGFPQLN